MRRFLFLLVILSAGLCFGGDRSVVIAVDTSRSLSTENLQQISEKLSQDLTALPTEITVGLIAFDDTARWITEPTSDRASLIRSLDQLKPSGNYTVLNDAIFLAARKLENGGIIILVSDGRDENSAVRVEDVQKLCSENHVAILSMASGRVRDERALRRLSMLSGGRFLGELDEVQPADFTAHITQTLTAQLELESTPVPVEQPETPTAPTHRDLQETRPISPVRPHHLRRLLPIGMSVLILCLIGWFLFHKKGPVNETCSHCGCALEDGVCLNCEMKAVEEAARTDRVADAAAPGPASLDPEALARDTLPGNIDRTMSLGEVAVLMVQEEGLPNEPTACHETASSPLAAHQGSIPLSWGIRPSALSISKSSAGKVSTTSSISEPQMELWSTRRVSGSIASTRVIRFEPV